jgi:3-oxoacyl-[acyl-carrier-protein] synthase-3
MPYFEFQHIKISAISAAVPKTVVKVADYAEKFGEEYVAHFQESTGIKQFRKTAEHQTASDLCFAAAENIISRKSVNREEIGALVFVAHSTDYRRPATACVLHKRLKLSKDCAAFDISLGCSAFVYGLQTVCSLMQNSDIHKALLLVGETLTKMTHPLDKSVSLLFGDAGSAILLEKDTTAENIKGILKTDGNGYQNIIAPAGGFRNMNATHEDFVWEDGNVRSLYNTIMQGENVFSFSISVVPKTIKEFFEKTGTTVDDYDCLAFHQANRFITKMLAMKLKVNMDRIPLCLDRYGNSSAPAIPLVMCDKYGTASDDQYLHFLMCGFGVGLSWGVCSAWVHTDDIYPIIESDEIFEEGIINAPSDFIK